MVAVVDANFIINILLYFARVAQYNKETCWLKITLPLVLLRLQKRANHFVPCFFCLFADGDGSELDRVVPGLPQTEADHLCLVLLVRLPHLEISIELYVAPPDHVQGQLGQRVNREGERRARPGAHAKRSPQVVRYYFACKEQKRFILYIFFTIIIAPSLMNRSGVKFLGLSQFFSSFIMKSAFGWMSTCNVYNCTCSVWCSIKYCQNNFIENEILF